ncbi:MAG TPA: hypothetical protein VL992_03250 [Tepidisphaeraceae bacterium]|nr:hypothetical protein [Tepidisphaeraceae bacterium]
MLADIVWNRDTIAVVAVFSIPIVSIIAGIWSQVEKHRSDNELKLRMVERGMSAEEIERIMAAKSPSGREWKYRDRPVR